MTTDDAHPAEERCEGAPSQGCTPVVPAVYGVLRVLALTIVGSGEANCHNGQFPMTTQMLWHNRRMQDLLSH